MYFRSVLIFMALLILSACGGGGGSPAPQPGPQGGLVDALGNNISEVTADEPVVMNMRGLRANQAYRILITDPNGAARHPEGGYMATTDESGQLHNLAIIQDLGTVNDNLPRGTSTNPNGTREVAEGRYQIEIRDLVGNVVYDMSINANAGSHMFCANGQGQPQASFLPTDTVYVRFNLDSTQIVDGNYNVYIMSDSNRVLRNDDFLVGTIVGVNIASGNALLAIGSYANGLYDVVLDVDGNGKFNLGTDIISRHQRLNPCFTIQTVNTGGPIIGQIASDRFGNHRHVFDPNAVFENMRDIYAYIAPAERSQIQETLGVKKFVVAHQNVWSQGDVLQDVTAGIEIDPVQGFCTNEAPWLVWPRQLLVAGCYDVVVDINRNGIFDAGIDLVDNIDSNGANTCGLVVADSACSNTIVISSHSNNQIVDTTAIDLQGTVGADVVSGKITIAAREQFNEIDLSLSGTSFNSTIPLFNGNNVITVSTEDSNGRICSRTIQIISDVVNTGTLIRAQLVWEIGDASYDMDLHLVRPNGVFQTSDDCYYSNCKTGGLDWGITSYLGDNPQLDVDCISNCSRIENIIMNEINDDGAYKVYVDAYSGIGGNVRVNIYIRDSLVSTVNCGDLANPNICTVGTINWTGGNTGNGSFQPDGTVGPTPLSLLPRLPKPKK